MGRKAPFLYFPEEMNRRFAIQELTSRFIEASSTPGEWFVIKPNPPGGAKIISSLEPQSELDSDYLREHLPNSFKFDYCEIQYK